MNRRSVIRSILGLAVAPKILAEIDFKPVIAPAAMTHLFKDLQFVIPDWVPRIIEKYGNNDFIAIMQAAAKDDDFPMIAAFTHYDSECQIIDPKECSFDIDEIQNRMKEIGALEDTEYEIVTPKHTPLI